MRRLWEDLIVLSRLKGAETYLKTEEQENHPEIQNTRSFMFSSQWEIYEKVVYIVMSSVRSEKKNICWIPCFIGMRFFLYFYSDNSALPRSKVNPIIVNTFGFLFVTKFKRYIGSNKKVLAICCGSQHIGIRTCLEWLLKQLAKLALRLGSKSCYWNAIVLVGQHSEKWLKRNSRSINIIYISLRWNTLLCKPSSYNVSANRQE